MDPFHAKLVAAATGSTMTALTMTPFDVVKTRLQTQRPVQQSLFSGPPPNSCCQPEGVACVRKMSTFAKPAVEAELVCVWDHGVMRAEPVRGFFDAVKHVWRAEGLRGLWKGSATSLVIGVPSSTAYMLTYDHLLNFVFPALLPANLVPMISGITARSLISSIASPLELVRTNLQSTPLSPSQPHTLRSVLQSINACIQRDGIRCLYRGLGPTLWRDVPFSGIYWASYETIKSSFARHNHTGASVAFTGGAIGGILAALVTHPLDVIKTRQQATVIHTRTERISNLALARQMARTEGIRALFSGVVPRIVKISPACGIMIASFEGVGHLLANPKS